MEILLKARRPLEESEDAMEEALSTLINTPGVEGLLVNTGSYLLEYRDEIPFLKELAKASVALMENGCIELAQVLAHPIGAYLQARRALIDLKRKGKGCPKLERGVGRLGALLAYLEGKLAGRDVKDRSIYYYLLSPYVRLPYSGVKIKANPPSLPLEEERELEDGSKVLIYGGSSPLYFILPVEFRESMDKAIEKVREKLEVGLLHKRHVVEEIASTFGKGIVIARNVVGLGPIEALFLDEEIEDVYVNGPDERVVVKHTRYGELPTNIYVGQQELERWESLARLITGRPFDDLTPVIDGVLNTNVKVRFSGVREPLSKGIAFSFRRHKEYTLTLPRLVKDGFLTPREAAQLWLVVHGGRSMLIAGPRGGGKTTLLAALLFELLPQHRLIIIEDTPELPTEELKSLGYNVLSLNTKQVIGESYGLPPEEVLRASLRLGDSALVVGEVRGKEAKVLYEAMRVGALSNFVGGTIHAESPMGVFDRVVNDLGVKRSSFKATDVLVMLGLRHNLSHKRYERRVEGIYSQVKEWEKAPLFQQFSESYLIDEIGRRHNLRREEVEEVVAAREEYYRYLSLKGAFEPSIIGEANKTFLEVVERFDRLEKEKIIGAFKEAVKI